MLFTESEEGVDDDGNVIEEDGADQNGKRKRFRQEVVKKVCLVFSCYNVYLENTIISTVASLFWSVFLDTMSLWENHKIASETLRVNNFKNKSLTLSKRETNDLAKVLSLARIIIVHVCINYQKQICLFSTDIISCVCLLCQFYLKVALSFPII